MLPKPLACVGCPFFHKGEGYVPGEGPVPARVAIIGQGPGASEVETGRPFRAESHTEGAPAGRKLNAMLLAAGFSYRWRWDEAYVDNVVRCRIRTGKKDEAPAAAVRVCTERHLHPALRKVRPEWIVAVGTNASRHFLGPWAGLEAAGTLLEVPDVF